ncbi:MAG: RNA signal recognition particle [Candidatus Buchananbacteria bacterium RIFCSPLOWO2_01_FULL_46_12]|uniref:RNA signal recognition particle n=2 Tax=Candidatus Buchananiibacteriota TaxID=1817903 RepID=A0A1G1YNJ4_9BACT|nr:MAG: RNA signal recognition particle [Candidatus Buchananbacteria bacterium RIFCSPHIGHO2_01_FULL_44_11]OGY53874.1 MAG: RNA signal recognition particle [Candidatus Buchananbacteria bacterium RIFCSPLOWO2_01_FULL_46_12]
MAKNQTKYVDGFVLVVPKKRVKEYRKMARQGGQMWKKYGALDYKECMLDDAKPEWVTFIFPKMAKAKPGETVWFSYIEYKSKKHRDQVNARVMKDPSMQPTDPNQMEKMPFDMKRMAYGGFKVVVSI